jgi:ferredoxin/coenzyme F420-reducing hydrogenase delta subunit
VKFSNNEENPGPLYCSGLLGTGPVPARVLPPYVVPCLGSISAALVLARVLRDEQPPEVITGSCEECPMRRGEKGYRQRERGIQSLFDYLGIGFSPVRVSRGSAGERQDLSRQHGVFEAGVKASKALSRRAFLGHLRDSAVTYRPQPARKDARPGGVESGHGGPTEETRSLVEILRRYAGGVAGEKGAVPGFTEIRVDESCTGCGACAGLCPTGALLVDEGPAAVQLKWTPAHCSHCNLCFDVCSRKALHLAPCLDAGRIAGKTTSTIKVFQRHLCQACGNSFLSSGSGVCCSDCSKTENLMRALSVMIYGEERRTAS